MNIIERGQVFLLAFLCSILSFQDVSAQNYIRYVKPQDFGTKVMYADSVLTSVMLPRGVTSLVNYPEINSVIYQLHRVLRDPDKELMQIWVCGSASPEGLWGDNVKIAEKRTEAAAAYIRDVTGIPDYMIHKESLNEDWDRLAEMIVESDIPYKYEVLYIIRAKSWGERKSALQKLDGGRVWDILQRDFFPKLQCVRFAIFCKWDPSKPYLSEPEEEVYFPSVAKDTVYIRDTVYVVKETVVVNQQQEQTVNQQEQKTSLTVIQQPEQETAVKQPVVEPIAKEEAYQQYRQKYIRERKYWDTPWMMGVKTNLVSDAMAVPMLGLEFQIGNSMSFDIQGWWSNCNIFNKDDKNASMYGFAPELRWWLSDHIMSKGFFLGLHARCVWYTLQWTDGLLYQNGPENVWNGNFHDSGNSTPAWSAGVTGGYSLGLGRKANWGLEFVVGVGYGSYRQNVATFNGTGWQFLAHENKQHFGITHVGLNLTYRFSMRRVRPENE